MEQTQERIDAMARICAGMTLEEMQNAPFDYKSLLEILQRRDVRNACVPSPCEMPDDLDWDRAPDAFTAGQVTGWNDCIKTMISKMGEQK